jgi:alkaline phosphatase
MLTLINVLIAESDPKYWNRLSESALRRSLKQQIVHKKAKNVILFLGDGMSVSTITASRILKGQLMNKSGEESVLSFEDFPHISLIKVSILIFK